MRKQKVVDNAIMIFASHVFDQAVIILRLNKIFTSLLLFFDIIKTALLLDGYKRILFEG